MESSTKAEPDVVDGQNLSEETFRPVVDLSSSSDSEYTGIIQTRLLLMGISADLRRLSA